MLRCELARDPSQTSALTYNEIPESWRKIRHATPMTARTFYSVGRSLGPHTREFGVAAYGDAGRGEANARISYCLRMVPARWLLTDPDIAAAIDRDSSAPVSVGRKVAMP